MVKLLMANVGTLNDFKTALQDAFRVAVEADLGQPLEEPIPPDADIEQSIAVDGAATYWIMENDQRVGGAVLVVDEISHLNSLSFFFISTNQQSRGLGLQAWKAIENEYPNTKVWETVTPHFEKRNIHFYVNRCGFKIVEFYNKFHPDPNQTSGQVHLEGEDNEMLRFMKVMDHK
ncbi:GNAT family N-acetyltransferase [Pseudomonas sp. W5-36]|uniref:GNAT family N-acetyltransferase n=1 Tax=Pseudomonas sp. W5-36 TaxID=3097455 RepID=UPI00397CC2DA